MNEVAFDSGSNPGYTGAGASFMLDCHQTERGFQVFFKNRKVLEHDSEIPWIRVGQGQFRMAHGGFKIRDEITWSRRWCFPAPIGEPPVFYRATSPFASLFASLRTPARR
jgi:hypothetical protein